MSDFTDGTTSGVVTTEIVPNAGIKMISIRVPATFVWGTDAIIVDLADYGASDISGFLCFEETTEGSVAIAGTGTTAVSGTTLTFTSTGSGANTVGGTLIVFAY